MKPTIVKVAELLRRCPECGGDSRAYQIEDGSFSPIVAVCLNCGHAWHIRRGTHAYGAYFTVMQENER